jgi:hypothetical protein
MEEQPTIKDILIAFMEYQMETKPLIANFTHNWIATDFLEKNEQYAMIINERLERAAYECGKRHERFNQKRDDLIEAGAKNCPKEKDFSDYKHLDSMA